MEIQERVLYDYDWLCHYVKSYLYFSFENSSNKIPNYIKKTQFCESHFIIIYFNFEEIFKFLDFL
jgi:hypothetical protein